MSDGQGMITNATFIKGASSAIIAGVLDRTVLGINNMTNNAYFGASVGAGILVGNMIGSTVPSIMQDTAYYNGKTIAQRSFEVIGGTGLSYALIQMTTPNYGDFYKRTRVVVATDYISEYITDYLIGNQLSYLS